MRISRTALLATTLLSGVAFANPAFAQTAPTTVPPANPQAQPEVNATATDQTPATQENPADTQNPRDAQDVEKGAAETIVITGSRIASPNITSLAPVQVIGEQQINQTGAINIQEVLNRNPVVSAPALSARNTVFTTASAGITSTDIHDLGPNRTLVLINNRRVVGGFPGTAIVDLNVIPTQFLERVDILTGGASSLYGSDAVAGVVNFIYKRNFSGLLLEGQYGITEKGDNPRYQLSATAGGNFLDNRGNIMFFAGYTKDSGLMARERKDTRVDFNKCFDNEDPATFTCVVSPTFSAFAPQGSFSVVNEFGRNETFTFGPTGQLQPCFTSSGPTCSFDPDGPDGPLAPLTGVGPNGFNRQFFRTLSVPVSRYLLAERGNLDITDNISFITEATFANTHAVGQQEPFALADANVFPATARVPIGTFEVNPDTGLPELLVNPFIPAPIVAAATDTDGDGIPDFGFSKRLLDFGTRHQETERNFFRIVTGFEGSLFGDRWHWDATYNYGHVSEFQHSTGAVNTPNFAAALMAIPDTFDINGNGITDEIICADQQAAAAGCVPINIFGMGTITPAMKAWVQADQQETVRQTQQVWNANLSGSVVDLPAGPLGLAIGAEYRKESSAQDWDALTNAGLNAQNAAPDTAGKFDVKEAYAEVNIPILKDMPFASQLDVRAAGRLSKYNFVDKTVKTWNIGGDYAPIPDIRFRGTYAKAVRAPNIGELFTGPSQTFPPGLIDPCQDVGLTGDSPAGGNGDLCRAAPGVLANINAHGGKFTLSLADEQSISGFNSGNPNLQPEVSKSLTLGVVVNPRSITALRNLVLTADFYNIKLTGVINLLPRQFILTQCYTNGDPFFCGLITRRPTDIGPNSAGSINFINSQGFNGGTAQSKGLDFTLTYRTGLGSIMPGLGMNVNLAWNHLLKGFIIPTPGAPVDKFIGEVGSAKDRLYGNIGFDAGKWGIDFNGQYIGKSLEDDQFMQQIGLDEDAIIIPAKFYLSSQIRFNPVRQYEFYVGVDNLLNTKAPAIEAGLPFNQTGTHTNGLYDIFGRRYYAGVRLRF